MSEQKYILGFLPCKCIDTCWVADLCNDEKSVLVPNVKRLACLCMHAERTGLQNYKDAPNCENLDKRLCVYDAFYFVAGEFEKATRYILNYREDNRDPYFLEKVFRIFARCYTEYDLGFLRPLYEQLKAIVHAPRIYAINR